MTKLYQRTTEEWSGYEFVDRHGLHAKRVERVRKTTRKILGVMGIKSQNTIVTPPQPDEEQLLRDDFSSGFIDYIYEDVGNAPRSKKVHYRNIHGDSDSTLRTISDRSAATIPRNQLVAGIPRWYEKGVRKDGTPVKHDVIDHVLMVEPDIIGRHALTNGLVQGVWKGTRMVGDRAVDYEQGAFGSLLVGSPVKQGTTETLSPESQEVLVSYTLNHKGRVQKALRALAHELEGYRHRAPAAMLSQLRRYDAPADITQEGVTQMIRSAAKKTTTAHGIEDRLAAQLYSSNITLTKYYDIENIQKLNEISPIVIKIDGEEMLLRYENGEPYVTNLAKRHIMHTKAPLFLKDGREVRYQRRAEIGRAHV